VCHVDNPLSGQRHHAVGEIHYALSMPAPILTD
jgi:hypothetical protein